ncbi:unnamed protein product [Lactuca virosa]|uniref:CCR4-NOT transcription complex subunit 11 n=1 Tax=Lactuca virosa TaxID=75947 RepID=A0AAU9NAQ9_9ASTR|nr:unnamed protein product [Lactuca virosa]
MRHFNIELLKESPSPAIRTCARLAQLQPFFGRELFATGFVSCCSQLCESSQKALVRSLEMAFSSPNIPPEILATLLNLAEFMEHDEKPLPIYIRLRENILTKNKLHDMICWLSSFTALQCIYSKSHILWMEKRVTRIIGAGVQY